MIEARKRTRDLLLVCGALTWGAGAVAETTAAPADKPTETAQPVDKAKPPQAAHPERTIPEKVAEPGAHAEGGAARVTKAAEPRVSPELLDAYRKAQEALRSAQELEGKAKLQTRAKTPDVAATGNNPAAATPPALPADIVEKIAEARAHAARELALAREKLKSAQTDKLSWKPTPEERVKIEAALEARLAESKASRAQRAETERTKVEERWGDALERPAVQTELKRHAWRVARLRQILAVAEAAGKTELVERAQLLLQQETEAHEKRFAELSVGDKEGAAKLPAAAKAKTPQNAALQAPAAKTQAQGAEK